MSVSWCTLFTAVARPGHHLSSLRHARALNTSTCHVLALKTSTFDVFAGESLEIQSLLSQIPPVIRICVQDRMCLVRTCQFVSSTLPEVSILKKFRVGLVFEAHRLLYHATLGLIVMMMKKNGVQHAHASVPRTCMCLLTDARVNPIHVRVCPPALIAGSNHRFQLP